MSGNRIKSVIVTGLALSVLVAAPRAAVVQIDGGEAGYSETGSWGESPQGVGNNHRWQSTPNNGGTATWSFSGLASGKYCVSASWVLGGSRTTAAQYSLTDGAPASTIDQTSAAAMDFDAVSDVPHARLSDFNGYVPVSITDGTFAVTASHSVAGAFLISDSVRLESVDDDVEKVYIIDNEDATGYSETGGAWATWSGDANDHRVGIRFVSGSVPTADTATFSFTGLESGIYRVSASWTAGGSRPNDATYIIPGVGSAVVNQKLPPDDDVFEDANWETLFPWVDVSGGSLSVILTNGVGGSGHTLIADAVRLERITPQSFALIEDFESHTLGTEPSSANGWSEVNGNALGSILDEEGNKVARILGSNGPGYSKPLGANTIADGTSGTLFFRTRSDPAEWFQMVAGLAQGNGSASTWAAYRAGFYSVWGQGDGTSMRPHWNTGNIQDVLGAVWYNVWVVADNADDTFSLHISQNYDGAIGGATSMTVDTDVAFPSAAGDLDYFIFMGSDANTSTGGRIDDIYIAQGANLNLPDDIQPPQGTVFIIR